MQGYNTFDRDTLIRQLEAENQPRTTLSFYRYVRLDDPFALRQRLFTEWPGMGIRGRIYLAKEGVNAQLSLPAARLDEFRAWIDACPGFEQIPFKIAVEDDGKSFLKLIVKVKKKIVADGLDDDAFDTTNVGRHLDAKSWNDALAQPDTIVVDMRNCYESEVGRFPGALCPDVVTFREELPLVLDSLKGKEQSKVLLYCTGGVRCEKASAFLRHHGFEDVNQLHGGIIDYTRQVRAEGLENRFIGKNFVFDERMGERISDDVIAHCHQCGKPADTDVNCANEACHVLFIQCSECAAKMEQCCSFACRDEVHLPLAEQKARRKGRHAEVHQLYRPTIQRLEE